jgi:hypothetical protein
MIIYMRLKLELHDDLLREVKKRAAERNLTVSDFVNEALCAALMLPPEQARPYTPITFGRSGQPSRHESADFNACLEDEDRKRLR